MALTQISASMLSADAAFPTGAGPIAYMGATAPTGWVLASGRTIGNAASGATERANADTSALFALLWGSLADAQAPVSGGRGASAAADFAANKTITVPDLRGRVAAGKDDMGGTAANVLNTTLTGTRASASNGVITGLSSTVGLSIGMSATGAGIGANAVITSIDSATQVTLSVANTQTGTNVIRFGIVDGATLGATGGAHTHALVTAQMPVHNHAFTAVINTGAGGSTTGASAASAGTTGNRGGDQAHPNLQPTIITNMIIKL